MGRRSHQGWTDLTIVPPFSFRVVDVLVTNFHLPTSSLHLMVCSFGGRERILAAYAEAVRNGYRFYSYGDAMVIF
jgi:S-adenosylmethionine:tRNA ribosyltransferase-isomerase